MSRLTASLVEFVRPIPAERLPRLTVRIRRGLRLAALFAPVFSIGSPLFLLTAWIAGPVSPAEVATCVVSTAAALSVLFASRSRWAEVHPEVLGFALVLVVVFPVLLQAWAAPEAVRSLLPAMLTVPATLVVFLPLRPFATMLNVWVTAILIGATRWILGQTVLQSPSDLFVVAAVSLGTGIGAQMLRQQWLDTEATKAELIAAGRLALLGQLSAGIAHELKTPIAAILNSQASADAAVVEFLDSVGHPEVTDDDLREIGTELRDHSGRIRGSAERAARYIQAVRNHAAAKRDQPREFRVDERVAEVLELLTYLVKRSPARIIVEDMPATLTLFGEPEQFDQILSNLVANALQACAEIESGAEVRISAAAVGDLVKVVVEDNGPGVPESLRATLFQPMITTKADSTGLGLAISREIASSRFGGSLELTGASRFVLTCRTAAAHVSRERDRGEPLATLARTAAGR